jgi:hypothetical protein
MENIIIIQIKSFKYENPLSLNYDNIDNIFPIMASHSNCKSDQ